MIDDDIDEGNEQFAILGSVVALDDGVAVFTILDDDTRGILVSPTTVNVLEGAGGSGQEYSLVLVSQPTARVTVRFGVMDAEGVRVSDIYLDGQQPFPSLLFDPDDWDTPQIVTVEMSNNNHIQPRLTVVTITHTVFGGDYEGLHAPPTTVNVTDSEPGNTTITLSLFERNAIGGLESLENLKESDGPVSMAVAAEIGIALYVDAHIALTDAGGTADSADYTLTPVGAPLLIRAGETRGTATFTLTPTDDDIDEDTETVEIAGNASGDAADFIASIAPASFRIIDDDTRSVIVTSPVTVLEGGGRRSYKVRLGSQPDGGDVEVRITGVTRAPEDEGQGRRLRFFPDSSAIVSIISEPNGDFAPVGEGIVLIFTAADWLKDKEQTVYVELSSNDVEQDDSEAIITHEVSGGNYDDVEVPDVVLKLSESGFFVTVPEDLRVFEGRSASYRIRLTSQPVDDVVVRVILPSDSSIGLSRNPGVLTFTTGNWNTPQFVVVEYEDDDLSTRNQFLEITHTAESNDTDYDSGGVSVVSVSLNFLDDDGFPSIRLVLSPSEADEGDRDLEDEETLTRTISVEVTAEFEGPARSEDTMISLSLGLNGDTADADDYSTELSPDAFLVIPQGATSSTDDGAQPFSFMLTLVQDRIDEDDEAFTLRAVDNAYILDDASAVFTIIDDDRAGIEVTPVEPRRLRKGQTAEYSVALTSQPTGEVTVNVNAQGRPGFEVHAPDDISISTQSLLFAADSWFVPQAVTVTAVDNSTDVNPGFGEVNIIFSVVASTGDPKYEDTFQEIRRLEIIEADATLGRLQLMADGEEIALTNLAGDSTGLMSDVREYSAAIPFDVDEVRITAAPSVTQMPVEDGDQNPGTVRIFGTNLPRDVSREGEPGAELTVDLDLSGVDDFTFFVEVFVAGDDPDIDDPVIETYTLTLTRALPAIVELKVFRADDGLEASTLIFGPEDDAMELVFVLTDAGDNGYSIGNLMPLPLPLCDSCQIMPGNDGEITTTITLFDGREFEVAIAEEEEGEDGTLETKVTLSRAGVQGADIQFSLAFLAEPARPVADDADDADALSAGIYVFLEDNTPTETEISITYRGHSQGQVETLTPTQEIITVSDNGPVTFYLDVIYESGGMRSFEPGRFTFDVVPAPADNGVTLAGGILTIDPESANTDIQVTVSATADDVLVARGFSPTPPRIINITFKHPTAAIQPVAQPVVEFDPVREFTDPLFVFVDEPKKLPLEVVLAEDSTPLDGSGTILGNLALALTLTTAGEITATVSIIEGDGESGSPGAPGRILSFEVAEVQNNVNVEVYVADADQDPRVTVAPFRFKTHFLSLAHEDEIQFSDVGNPDDFAPDTEVITVSLAGADPAGERWTLSVANSGRLEGNGYSVEEVIFVTRITQVNEIVKKTVDGATKTFELGTETLLNGEVIKPVVFVEVDTRTLSVDVWDFLSAFDVTVQTKTLVSEIAREVYRLLTAAEMGEDRATRSLRIARLRADAEDSRVLLRFDYYLPGVAEREGFFYRTVAIDTGLVAALRVEVTPDSVVVAKGGTGEVTLVVSNLDPGEGSHRLHYVQEGCGSEHRSW